MGTSKQTKTFFLQNFYYLFPAYEKYFFDNFKVFLTNLLIWSTYVFSKWNTFLIGCNKGLFLDVNQKNCFFDIQNIPKAAKLKKCIQKKIPELFSYINIDFIHLKKMWIIHAN